MADFDRKPNPGEHDFLVTVNGKRVALGDSLVDGRKVLRKAGFNPSDEHVLIELMHPGSQSRGLDEDISLQATKPKAFRAFASDRTFNFTIDEIGYEWGGSEISVSELHEISGVSREQVFILEREDEPDAVLAEDGKIVLTGKGTEHLRSGKRTVTVRYNHNPFELERRIYSTEELLVIFGVPAGYILDQVKPDGSFNELKPGERVKVREGMEFVSHAPCGQSS